MLSDDRRLIFLATQRHRLNEAWCAWLASQGGADVMEAWQEARAEYVERLRRFLAVTDADERAEMRDELFARILKGWGKAVGDEEVDDFFIAILSRYEACQDAVDGQFGRRAADRALLMAEVKTL